MIPVDVSIVILHRNGYQLLHDCLLSVMEHTRDATYEIIVVDNASTDCSMESLRRDFPDVIVVESAVNLGFACGNNLGSRPASGKYLFFLNYDTLLLNDAVGIFHRFSQVRVDGTLGALGTFLVGRGGSAEHSCGRFPATFSQFSIFLENLGLLHRERRFTEAAARSSKTWFPVDFLTAAALFVRRDVFLEMGGFDEDFFLYFEETELQHRMAKAGYGRYIVRGPRIMHYGGGGGSRSNWRRMETYRGMFLYYRKTQGRGSLLLFRFLSPFFVMAHLFHPAFTLRENLAFIRFCFTELRRRDH